MKRARFIHSGHPWNDRCVLLVRLPYSILKKERLPILQSAADMAKSLVTLEKGTVCSAWNYCGQRLATGSDDGTLAVFDSRDPASSSSFTCTSKSRVRNPLPLICLQIVNFFILSHVNLALIRCKLCYSANYILEVCSFLFWKKGGRLSLLHGIGPLVLELRLSEPL